MTQDNEESVQPKRVLRSEVSKEAAVGGQPSNVQEDVLMEDLLEEEEEEFLDSTVPRNTFTTKRSSKRRLT